jgi:hypothetical protein
MLLTQYKMAKKQIQNEVYQCSQLLENLFCLLLRAACSYVPLLLGIYTVKYCLIGFKCFQYIKQPFVITDTLFPVVELANKTNYLCKYTQNSYQKRGQLL